MSLKELLVQYEIQNHLSHAELAEKIGVSLSTFYRWFNGESKVPKKTTMQKLSKVLGDDVVKTVDEMNKG